MAVPKKRYAIFRRALLISRNRLREGIERLREAAQLGSPDTEEIEGGQLMISLPPQALALIEIQ